MKPTLFIFSGLPGSGKTTLSKRLAKAKNAVYLRIDTVEQAMKDFSFDVLCRNLFLGGASAKI
jgi:predicted kinase